MNSDNPTKQISLNLVAICVFGMTCSSLVLPLFQISSTIPIAIVFAIIVVTTLDGFFFKSIVATLLLDTIASTSPAYRQRILHHEAGHFLVAHLLGIPITDYTLNAWESLKAGQSAQGGTIFAAPPSEISAQLLQKYCTVWMAGIAAEKLIYDRAEGGSEDRQKLRGVLFLAGKQQQEIVSQENLATLQAKTLIQTYGEAYQALVDAMSARTTVSECCKEIDRYIILNKSN
jgi:ATP-dependent Zn protease